MNEDLLAGIYAAILLAGIYTAIANPYKSLSEPQYNGNTHPECKTQLTKKQKKKRAAAKLARKARRKQRR